CGYELLTLSTTMLPHNSQLAEAFELAKKLYYDSLIAQGSNNFQTARQKAQMFAERNTGIDTLARARLDAENERTVQELFDSAVSVLERARSLIPESIPAYSGLLRCYKHMGNTAKAAETQRILDRLVSTGRLPVGSIENDELPPLSQTPDFSSAPPPLNPGIELERIHNFLRERDFDAALTSIERLLIQDPRLIEALHLKVRIFTEKRLYHPASIILKRAFEIDPYNETTKQLQIDFLESKLKALSHGADVFLKKALKLGPSLGRDYFRRAAKLLQKSIVIAPDELSLLDQLYTCYMYLDDDRQAALIRREIALINPNYVTTIARFRRSSLCFLAGYAYDEAPESLEPFRRIRRRLIRKRAGRYVVTWYSRLSPILIETAKALRVPRLLFRMFLFPLLETARRALKTP
ncbi:MAG TPA: hypothetical protein PKM25_17465, partial [Candidatus Ozemobacteraceae bacterium]|nr:hypothetical protein [Candidatus Ozemobacteraceae bacterium]